MNSFTLHAVGNLAKDPEVGIKTGKAYTRFCLVGNDYVGKDADGDAREATTSIWMVAFGSIGDAIAKNSRKGDQIFIHGHIRSNKWMRDGEMQYDHSFIVDGFRFGAPGRTTREQLSHTTRKEQSQLPPYTPTGQTSDELVATSTPPALMRPELERRAALS